jgi:hypothetical protein
LLRDVPFTLNELHALMLLRIPVECHWLLLASDGFLTTLGKLSRLSAGFAAPRLAAPRYAAGIYRMGFAEIVFQSLTKSTCF